MHQRGHALRRVGRNCLLEELGGHKVGLDFVANLLEKALSQALSGWVASVREEDCPEADAAANGFLQRADSFYGEAAIAGKVTVRVDGPEVLKQRVVAARNRAEAVAQGRGGHRERVPK